MSDVNSVMGKEKVSIIGCGVIGTHWGTLFASAGYNVSLYDANREAVETAKGAIEHNLLMLEANNLLRGPYSAADQFKNVSSSADLADCLKGSVYCQESTAECEKVKAEIFTEMEALCDDDTVLASSTSTIPASKFTAQLKRKSQCLVAHPVNPPVFLRLVEVVPSPWTSAEIVDKTCNIMKKIGQRPVRIQREVIGFALNRLQFAVIAEAWRMVNEGIISPDDVDAVMKEGLGPRYAFYGPFEVMHMNANGVEDYIKKFMNGVSNVLADFGPPPTFEEENAKKEIIATLNAQLPVSRLHEFSNERDSRLAELCKLKKRLAADEQKKY